MLHWIFYSKNVYDLYLASHISCKKYKRSLKWAVVDSRITYYLGPPVLSSSIILFPFLFVFSFVTIFGHINFFIMYIHSIVMFRNYVKPCHNPWEMRPVSFLLFFFHSCLSGLSKPIFFRRWGRVVVKASSSTRIFFGLWIFLMASNGSSVVWL